MGGGESIKASSAMRRDAPCRRLRIGRHVLVEDWMRMCSSVVGLDWLFEILVWGGGWRLTHWLCGQMFDVGIGDGVPLAALKEIFFSSTAACKLRCFFWQIAVVWCPMKIENSLCGPFFQLRFGSPQKTGFIASTSWLPHLVRWIVFFPI